MIRALVVDDHDLIRRSVSALLDDADDMVVVGQCANGVEAVETAIVAKPDVVLMDLFMPVLDGFEATRDLLRADPSVRVVILTSTLAEDSVQRAHAAGAVGYQLKTAPAAALLCAVRAVAEGRTAWDNRARKVLGR